MVIVADDMPGRDTARSGRLGGSDDHSGAGLFPRARYYTVLSSEIFGRWSVADDMVKPISK